MNNVYLLLGSNIGDSKAHLATAKTHIEFTLGRIVKASSIYKTEAWGNKNQAAFLNQVIHIVTPLDPEQTIDEIFAIEEKMGRKRTPKNAPRIIDIDILFFNSEVIKTGNLTVPHAEIQNRRFVLFPMTELSPDFTHPVLYKTMHCLLEDCTDTLNVQKI